MVHTTTNSLRRNMMGGRGLCNPVASRHRRRIYWHNPACGASSYEQRKHFTSVRDRGRTLLMSFLNRASRSSRTLTLCLALLLIGGSAFSLAHCYGEHAHEDSSGKCALCAFVCHVAAVLLSIVSFSCLALLCLLRLLPANRRGLRSIFSPYPIRAPPMSSP